MNRKEFEEKIRQTCEYCQGRGYIHEGKYNLGCPYCKGEGCKNMSGKKKDDQLWEKKQQENDQLNKTLEEINKKIKKEGDRSG